MPSQMSLHSQDEGFSGEHLELYQEHLGQHPGPLIPVNADRHVCAEESARRLTTGADLMCAMSDMR